LKVIGFEFFRALALLALKQAVKAVLIKKFTKSLVFIRLTSTFLNSRRWALIA
jgi:hypothetical protein